MTSIKDTHKKLSSEFDRIITSYHEAGHAVCALVNFMKVEYVEMQEDDRMGGETSFIDISDVHKYAQFETKSFISKIKKNEVCIRYAGIAAEKIIYKKLCGSSKFPRILSQGSSDDIQDISDIIKNYNLADAGTTRVQLKNTLSKKSSKQLEEHWNEVITIAHALFKRKRINYQEIKFLILKKTTNKSFWKNQFKLIDFYFDASKELDTANINFITSNF